METFVAVEAESSMQDQVWARRRRRCKNVWVFGATSARAWTVQRGHDRWSHWFGIVLLGGSELDPMIHDLLQASGLQVCHDMRRHDFSQHLRHSAGSLHLYVAGAPCQGFSPRNCKRKRWEDPRSSLLAEAMSKIHRTQAVDAALQENSHTMLNDQWLGRHAAFQV